VRLDYSHWEYDSFSNNPDQAEHAKSE
jgi:hypothetical protein